MQLCKNQKHSPCAQRLLFEAFEQAVENNGYRKAYEALPEENREVVNEVVNETLSRFVREGGKSWTSHCAQDAVLYGTGVEWLARLVGFTCQGFVLQGDRK